MRKPDEDELLMLFVARSLKKLSILELCPID
jgi:hypothetical protein